MEIRFIKQRQSKGQSLYALIDSRYYPYFRRDENSKKRSLARLKKDVLSYLEWVRSHGG